DEPVATDRQREPPKPRHRRPCRYPLPGRHHRPEGRLLPRMGGADARGHDDRVLGGHSAPRRRGRPRPPALVRRDPPAGLRRLRRSRDAPVGRGHVRGGARPAVRDRRDRLRHPLPGRQEPALAPGLPVPARDLRTAPHHLARLQPHGRRCDPGHGAVRGGARHAMAGRARVEARDVPAPGGLAAVRRQGRAQIPADGRRLLPLRGDDAPRHGAPFADLPPGAGARRGRSRRRPRRPARHDGHAGLPRRPAAIRARPPRLPGRRQARPRQPEARHRRLGDGRRV
ncbi:MAG: FIG01134926: hypothetical protein, partial [uncultured Acetobacteraceae bacterium]